MNRLNMASLISAALTFGLRVTPQVVQHSTRKEWSLVSDKFHPPSRRHHRVGDITVGVDEGYQNRADDYFKRFVPKGLLNVLGVSNIGEVDVGRHTECKVSVVFMDIRNFTTISEALTSEETFELINRFLGLAIPIIDRHGGIIDKFMGDAIMAIFPNDSDEALLAIRKIMRGLRSLELPAQVDGPLSVGAGINTGFVMLGALGNYQRMEVTVVGDAVNLASRLESLNKTYGTTCLISEATLNSLESPAQFSLRMIDRIKVKGKFRPQSIYELTDVYLEKKAQGIISNGVTFENALANFHMDNVEKAYKLFQTCADASPDDHVAQIYVERCQRFLQGGQLDSLSESSHDVAWKDDFNVHIQSVDDEHQQLLANVNKVVQLVREEDGEGLPVVLDFLRDYTAEHFRNEERLMQEYGYPYLSVQQHEHSRFIEYFNFVREEIESGKHDKLYLLFKIDIFLMDWLINHTTGSDKHMGKWLINAGCQQTA
jgi:hemerythrin-like metal-binding protein